MLRLVKLGLQGVSTAVGRVKREAPRRFVTQHDPEADRFAGSGDAKSRFRFGVRLVMVPFF